MKLNGWNLEVTILQYCSNRLNKFDLFINHDKLSSAEVGNGAIFTCAGISFALIWGKNQSFYSVLIVVTVKVVMIQMVYHFS